ncbi:DUF1311 domain-containing protein [Aquitalea palustris]|uniref:DUF1311 domain-containing protein n=1 Tax=Aquitalea palustris TaxID=2480983 RepID=A0A454JFV9_9NEIS|nr:lysozyme inhibitor LprI family protein [Aquitalea palustris]RMC94777.1 DUF1311 domain-containing protein [Aquitalea palustris]
MMKSKLTLCALLIASSATFAASFDCMKASNFVEKQICTDQQLSQMDESLSTNYKGMLNSNFGGSPKQLKKEQLAWVGQRNKCTTRQCIVDAYKKRLDETCDYGVVSGVHPECTSSDDFK